MPRNSNKNFIVGKSWLSPPTIDDTGQDLIDKIYNEMNRLSSIRSVQAVDRTA